MELRKSIDKARALRASATDAENALWRMLRGRRLGGFKFRRQVPINGYIVDFACLERAVVIEVDGGQHGLATDEDAKRCQVLAKSGFRVIRFWNDDVLLRWDDVTAEILRQLQAPPSP